MATSFTMTARDMVTQAMREIGVIASGESPTSDEMSDAIVRLNSMLKAWAAKGLNLWRDVDGAIDFAAGKSSKVLADALTIDNVRLLLADGVNTRPLGRWERDRLRMAPTMAEGEPLAYAVLNTANTLALQLYPVPDRAVTIRYSYGRVIADVVQPADPVDVPQMFQEAVWKNLAVKLAPTFGKARADQQTVQMVAADAAILERDMLDWDRPDSYFVGTDLDGYP